MLLKIQQYSSSNKILPFTNSTWWQIAIWKIDISKTFAPISAEF